MLGEDAASSVMETVIPVKIVVPYRALKRDFMKPIFSFSIVVWGAVLLLCVFGATFARGQSMPHFNHIIWVMEENLNYSDITSATWPNLYS